MSFSSSAGASRQSAELFQTTHWSAVLTAGRDSSPGVAAAIEELCRAYWYPLYAYVRRRGHDVEEAQDLTQEFFARLLQKHWLADADPDRGRFRNFLLGSVNHFLANEWRHSRAVKRGGGQVTISLDDTAEARYAQEPASDLTPEKLYERRCALSLFDCALNRLRGEYETSSKIRLYGQSSSRAALAKSRAALHQEAVALSRK